jgi:exosortase/archaeosortase family protein
LLFIALVYVYLLIASWQKKLLLLAPALPLAYLGNFIRLVGDVGAVNTLGQGMVAVCCCMFWWV